MVHGENCIVITGSGTSQVAVAASKSCTIDIGQEFIDSCSPVQGRTKDKIPTSYSWGVSCDCLMATTNDALKFLNAAKNGTKLTLQFIVGGFKQKGDAYVQSWKITGTKGNLATFNVQFVGSGGLSDATADGWDYHSGILYTYSDFDNGVLKMGGSISQPGGAGTPIILKKS